jgi:hypothetical protein
MPHILAQFSWKIDLQSALKGNQVPEQRDQERAPGKKGRGPQDGQLERDD